jgi:hypothetical protein
LELGFTNTVSLPTGLAFVLKVPSNDILPGVAYYLAFYDPTNPGLGLQLGFAGPAMVSGSTLTFISSTSSLTLVAATTYIFVLYGISSSAPSPTPIPTATAAPTGGGSFSLTFPTPAPVVCSPAPVDITVGQTTTITCAAQLYSSTLAVMVNNPAIASVVQVNQQSLTLFNVTGLVAGTTTASLQTKAGGVGSIVITVIP